MTWWNIAYDKKTRLDCPLSKKVLPYMRVQQVSALMKHLPTLIRSHEKL